LKISNRKGEKNECKSRINVLLIYSPILEPKVRTPTFHNILILTQIKLIHIFSSVYSIGCEGMLKKLLRNSSLTPSYNIKLADSIFFNVIIIKENNWEILYVLF